MSSYLDRIVDAMDVLNKSIQLFENDDFKIKYRSDYLVKMALAFYVQGNTINAVNYIVEAEKSPDATENKDLLYEIIRYWAEVFVSSDDFRGYVEQMTADMARWFRFEMMFWYSVIPFHEIPKRYQEAISCVAGGETMYVSRKMLKDTSAKPQYQLLFDEEKELYFFNISGKRLYYPGSDTGKIHSSFNTANLIEQSAYSPHLYFTDTFCVKNGDVFCDIGAAEANVALAVVEKCEKVYIFEGSSKWIAPLSATFAPFQDKTVIVEKMVSDCSHDEFISLDDYFGSDKVDFLKLDVEGYEMNVLKGAKKLLERNAGIRLCVCTYHKSEDANEIKNYLENLGFSTEFSDGYMVLVSDLQYHLGSDAHYPYFRHGLIRAWRDPGQNLR